MRVMLVGFVILAACGMEEPDRSFAGGGGSVASSRQPAPLFGGTVAVALDGRTVAVSDPDRDLLWLIDLNAGVKGSVALPAGSEPGRAIDDGRGSFVVALRKAGQLVRVSIAQRQASAPIAVCPEPRGLTRTEGAVLVACATGEVMRVDASEVTVLKVLEREARDVLEVQGRLLVTTFREAELFDLTTPTPRVQRPGPVPAFPRASRRSSSSRGSPGAPWPPRGARW
jgi:hypothetical protein